jgi:hypothetical protein
VFQMLVTMLAIVSVGGSTALSLLYICFTFEVLFTGSLMVRWLHGHCDGSLAAVLRMFHWNRVVHIRELVTVLKLANFFIFNFSDNRTTSWWRKFTTSPGMKCRFRTRNPWCSCCKMLNNRKCCLSSLERLI